MMLQSVFLYKVKVFDIAYSLNKIKDNNIKIHRLKKIDQYVYTFYSSTYNHSKLNTIFANIEIIKKTGYMSILFSLFKYKTTLLAMIISVFFYFSLASKIWQINIVGDANNLNSFIEKQLLNNNIYVGAKNMNSDELANVQNKILYDNYDVIEYLSIDKQGCSLNVKYKKKRKETDKIEFKGALYASKDGVIKSFDILSGEKVVKVNDYVKKGELLVKDILTTDYNEEVYVGTYGSVYAYTWYYIDIEHKKNLNESEIELFSNLLLESKRQISINFKDNEYIYEENVLQFNIDNNMVKMKIHFTCVEDIAKE